MTVLAVFSYGFIAFGPTVVLFAVTVARNAYQVILLMTGWVTYWRITELNFKRVLFSFHRAFFWLLSLFLASVIWTAVVPLRDTPAFTVPFSVLLQELFRYLYFLLLRYVCITVDYSCLRMPFDYIGKLIKYWRLSVMIQLLSENTKLPMVCQISDL